MYVVTYLRREGFDASILDCTFNSFEDTVHTVRHLKADYVGFFNMVTLTKRTLKLAAIAKERGLTTILGGPDPSLDPVKYLGTGLFDYVVVGEGEVTAAELVGRLEAGRGAEGVRGVAHLDRGGRIVWNGSRGVIKDLDSLPIPDRSLIDHERYRETWRHDHGFMLTSVITSRGCPWGCHFCSNPVAPFGRRYTYRSPENVVDELEVLVRKFGYDYVWFADDVFTVLKPRTLEICRLILERGIDLRWSCLTRADRVDSQVLNAMKRAGCVKIFYGVESGSQKILDAMNRGMKISQIRDAVAATKAAGIMVHAFMQMGFPGETYRTMTRTIGFLEELDPDEFSFTIAYPLPGTELFSKVKKYVKFEDEWDEPKENKLMFRSDLSEQAIRFAIWKATYGFLIRRRAKAGQVSFKLVKPVFDLLTGIALRLLAPSKERSIWDASQHYSFASPADEGCFIAKQRAPLLLDPTKRKTIWPRPAAVLSQAQRSEEAH